jgi:hypothetical protein
MAYRPPDARLQQEPRVAQTATTFRSVLVGEVLELLKSEGIFCAETSEAVVEIAVALSHYQEEGVALCPRLIVCTDLPSVLPLIQGTDQVNIGAGAKGDLTAKTALKKIAPLARGAWVGFIERKDHEFTYGVFRQSASPLALSLRETVKTMGSEESGGKPVLVLISQLAEKVVEIIGTHGAQHVLHLSAARANQPSPLDDISRLVTCITRDVDPTLQEEAGSYLRSNLPISLQRGHGALIAVTRGEIPIQLTDAVRIAPEALDLTAAVAQHLVAPTPETFGKLIASIEFLEGVLSCDGITIVSTSAKVLAYNSFIRLPESGSSGLPRQFAGGARRRAYEALMPLVDSGELAAVLMRSTDGAVFYYGGHQ